MVKCTLRAPFAKCGHILSYETVSRMTNPGVTKRLLLPSCCSRNFPQTPLSVPQKRKFSSDQQQQQQQPDYWTNDGIVEGVWMFSRHGDRTPARPLTPVHRQDEEAAFWMTKLPIPNSASAFDSYSKYFPVRNMQGKADFIDVVRNPFGFLTHKGLQQLHENGHRFFNRYNNHAHHLPECKDWRSARDFLKVWDVKVYSTNYLRTVMSVQSFLDGMFGTQCYKHIQEDQGATERLHDPTITKEERIPCSKSFNQEEINAGDGDDSQPLVEIRVRELRNDPLNAFDRNPAMIADLVGNVIGSDDFLQRDGKAASLAARLANFLPGLVRPNKNPKKSNRGGNRGFTLAPSGINWVEAADHFVCRESHNVPLSRFLDAETDTTRMEQTLQAMSHPTLAHLSWRFRKWYQYDRLLAVIAAPPLREIANQIVATPHLGVHERRPFCIYSCHDITILGLLYGIGADFLAIDQIEGNNDTSGDDAGSWRYWPPYGSNLVFELVRVQEGPPGPDSHVVRVLLNGHPVRSVKIDPRKASSVGTPREGSVDGGPEGMLFVNDFETIVAELERAGGHDYASMLGKT